MPTLLHGGTVLIPDWFWYVFLFAAGCCIGSFLNVVIYRLPREKSLVLPPSSCPACGRRIVWYDNIPLLSWVALGAKCRACKAPISPRYLVIELLTGLTFVGVFFLLFRSGLRTGIPDVLAGGWIIYLVSVAMLAAFIAASAIDMEMWIIPLSICWFVTVVGSIGAAVGPYVVDPAAIRQYLLLPSTGDLLFKESTVSALAAGALIGIGIANLLVLTGLLKRSYDMEPLRASSEAGKNTDVPEFDDRREIGREVLFLTPIILCSAAVLWLVRSLPGALDWWFDFSQHRLVAGLLGSVWGYVVGSAIVWVFRIFGTVAFGKEAIGLGDVHLMAAAGAVLGPMPVVAAFFAAPFFGLVWAAIQMVTKKTRQIPYGAFLSLGVLTVMIFHDRILNHISFLLYG